MMVSVCMRMLLPISCGILLFYNHSLSHPSAFSDFGHELIQQNTTLPDTAAPAITREATLQDSARSVAKGQVIDSEGRPFAGGTVSLQNYDNNTLTDENSAYE